MTQAQVHRVTRLIEAIGAFPAGSSDVDIDIVTLAPEQLARLSELGAKVLNLDGTITVTPPPPPPPPSPRPDYGNDATADNATVVDAVTNLRQYLGASSPSPTATVVALKLAIRLLLFLMKRQLG